MKTRLTAVRMVALVLSVALVVTICQGPAPTAADVFTQLPAGARVKTVEQLNGELLARQHDVMHQTMVFSAVDARADHPGAAFRYVSRFGASLDFSRARNLRLSDVQIGRFIDPRIPAAIRAEALRIMKAQASSERENVFVMEYGHPIANTWQDYVAGLKMVAEPLGNNLYRSREDGHVFVGSMSVPLTSAKRSSISPEDVDGSATGTFRKISLAGPSTAVRGYIEEPQCAWPQSFIFTDSPYTIYGGTAAAAGFPSLSSHVDSGLQWNPGTQTMELYFLQSKPALTPCPSFGCSPIAPVSGPFKFPCVPSTLPYNRFLLITTGISNIAGNPYFNLTAAEYTAAGSPTGLTDSIPPQLTAAGWLQCAPAACTLKRLFGIAQAGGTNAASGEEFAMSDSFIYSPYLTEVRVPLEEFINTTIGTLSTVPTSTFLGPAPFYNPSNANAIFAVLSDNFSGNDGTDSEGALLVPCAPTAPCIQE